MRRELGGGPLDSAQERTQFRSLLLGDGGRWLQESLTSDMEFGEIRLLVVVDVAIRGGVNLASQIFH